jgi:hypothetical protein
MAWDLDSTFLQKLLTMPKIGTPEARNHLRGQISLDIVPNIVSVSGVIEIFIPEPGSVELFVTDALGRTVLALDLGQRDGGKFAVNLLTDHMPVGHCTAWLLYDRKVIKANNFIVLK